MAGRWAACSFSQFISGTPGRRAPHDASPPQALRLGAADHRLDAAHPAGAPRRGGAPSGVGGRTTAAAPGGSKVVRLVPPIGAGGGRGGKKKPGGTIVEGT